METKTINVYRLEELTQESYKRAYLNWIDTNPADDVQNDFYALIEELNRILPVNILYNRYDGSVDWRERRYDEPHSNPYIEDILALKGERLMKWITNNLIEEEPAYIYSKDFNKNRKSGCRKREYIIDRRICGGPAHIAEDKIREIADGEYTHPDTGEVVGETFSEFLDRLCYEISAAYSAEYDYYTSYDNFEEEANMQDLLFFENGELFKDYAA